MLVPGTLERVGIGGIFGWLAVAMDVFFPSASIAGAGHFAGP
jgi:hypothetical protein